MALHKISGTTLRSLKPTTDNIDDKQHLDDGYGLVLLLSVKGGGRVWRFNYTFAGKHKTISLSTYPDTTLKFACNKADIAYKQIAEGIDPSDNRKQTKIEQQTRIAEEKREASDLPAIDSFAHVAHEWFEGRKHTSISSHGAYTLLLLTLSMNFDLR